MAGLNKVQIIGHLGNDPETCYTQSGVAVTNISVATSERWKDRDGNQQERTEWHRVTFWNKLAEIAGEYLRKGSQVYVEGKLQTDKYTDQNGVEKYTTKIIAEEMQMLGGRPDNDNRQASGGQQRNQSPRQQGGGGQDYAPRRQQPAQQQSAPPDDLDDDSIPF